MSATILPAGQAGPQDRVSKILIWVLLFVTVACFLGMAAATRITTAGVTACSAAATPIIPSVVAPARRHHCRDGPHRIAGC